MASLPPGALGGSAIYRRQKKDCLNFLYIETRCRRHLW